MDNVGEFTSKAFDDYCMELGIKVKHPVPYVHTQNGLAESLIKCIKLILDRCYNIPTYLSLVEDMRFCMLLL